jgi:flagellar hook-associated protein 1 FlgK
MSNLLTALASSANALSVFERALTVTQNNVANASTPGYAAQSLNLEAEGFEPSLGLIGGVRAGDVVSARNLYAEQAVRQQTESLGYYEQSAGSLTAIESNFDVTGTQGIPKALSNLFDSFSAWSLEPGSSTNRADVLNRAGELAQAFQQTTASLDNAGSDVDLQLQQTVDHINQLGADLVTCNHTRRQGNQNDAGLDTEIQNKLEELSELTNFTALYQKDGSVTVLLGGQTPLVVGENLYKVGVDTSMPTDPPPQYPSAHAPARLVAADGRDITSQITGGNLGALLDLRNNVLPSLGGDAYHAGDLNVLAKTVADRVNQILTSGNISDGPPPVAGLPLFSYDTTSDASVARTLTLNPDITADGLAPIQPGPPYVSNGSAAALAQLASPQNDADRLNGFSYTEYYGQIAGRVGSLLAEARDNQDLKTQSVTQAKSLRDGLSGVSLDAEAVKVLEFQRAYQANAQLVTVLSDLTQVAINMLPAS